MKTKCAPRAERGFRESFGRSVIDAVIEIFIRKCVRDSGKMHDGVALLQ